MLDYPKLKKTWIFDLDGTLVKHRAYETGEEVILPGVSELLSQIPENDMIVIITGRPKEHQDITIKNLKRLGIRYNHIIFDAGAGARMIVNDTKPSGYKTAHSFCATRNAGINTNDLRFFMEH